jgi:uncharacterized repeat protein (TIGR01451 family)
VIDDPLPSGTGIDWSIASGPANCTIQGSPPNETLHCAAVDLAPGASESVHVTSATSFQSCASLPNTASLTATNHPSLTADATTRVACASLTLAKTADAATVNAGEAIGFIVSASNSAAVGTGTAHGVVIDDPLPSAPGIDWSILTGPANCTIQGSPPNETLHCTGADLAPGAMFAVHVISSTTFASCAVLPNTASLTATNHPSVQASATTTVQCPALTLDKTADAASVSAGAPIGFSLTVSNAGPGTAKAATLNDPLPSGAGVDWSISPAYAGPGTCSITGAVGSEVLTCAFGDLADNASASVHVSSQTSAVSCQAYPNTGTASADNAPDATDSATTTVLCPEVSLVKTADADAVNAGEQIGFTVTASNSSAAGTGTAKAVVIDDPLPGGSGIDWSIAAGPTNCSIQGSPQSETLHCTAVDLAPGASESVHVVSGTSFASCANLVNVATLTGANVSTIEATADTTVLCPSLSLTKTADAAAVDAGAQIGFTVTVSNGGPGDATGVVLDDPLPAGTGVDWSIVSGPANCTIQGSPPTQTLHCTAVTLASVQSESVHVVSATAFASCAAYDNTATATATNSPAPAPASASTVVQCAAITLTKIAGADSVSAGSQIAFTVTATNSSAAGTGTAHGVVIDDPLPMGAGIDWTLASGSGNCSIDGSAPTQTLHCTAVDLGPGDTVTAHVTSPTEYASCAALPNTASLTASNHPSLTAEATTTVLCPSLGLTKNADAVTVSAGTSVGFTLVVNNGGPGTATAATLSDPLPAGPDIDWSIDPAYNGPGTCEITGEVGSQVLTCSFGELASGASVSIHVTSSTTANSCQALPNLATLSAANAPDVTADAAVTVQCPAVSLTKTADAATVDAGGEIGFTVTATNSDVEGTGTAAGVVIDDPLPAGSGVNWSIESGPENCAITGDVPTQTLHCAAVDLAPGASETVHVVSDTSFAACGTYDNTATLTLTNGAAPAPAEASTTVQCSALTLTKTADAASVDAGAQIGFSLAAANGGPGVATGVILIDTLPKGGDVTWSIDPGATTATGCSIQNHLDDQVLTCDLGDLAAGATVSVHLVSSTSTASCGAYPNTATLSADNAPELSAQARTSVKCHDTGGVVVTPTPTPDLPVTANTGAGPLGAEIAAVLALLGTGLLLLVLALPRRRGRHA